MTTVSPSPAASTAACTVVYAAAGQSALSSSTVSVAAYAPCAQHKTPALTSAGSNPYLKPLVPLRFARAEARTFPTTPDTAGTGRPPQLFGVDLSQRRQSAAASCAGMVERAFPRAWRCACRGRRPACPRRGPCPRRARSAGPCEACSAASLPRGPGRCRRSRRRPPRRRGVARPRSVGVACASSIAVPGRGANGGRSATDQHVVVRETLVGGECHRSVSTEVGREP